MLSMLAAVPQTPQLPATPEGWSDLLSASPAAAALIVVFLFLRHLRDQGKEQAAADTKREESRMQHEERLANQYASIAETQAACIRDNTAAFREFVQYRTIPDRREGVTR